MLAGLARLRIPEWAKPPWSLCLPDDERPRAMMTLVSAGILIILGGAYLEPERFARRPPPPGADPGLVQRIEEVAPVWVVGFLVCGVLLAVGVWTGRHLVWWHLAGQVMTAAYAIALWISAIAQEPDGPIIAPLLASAFCVLQKACRDSYIARPRVEAGSE